MMATSNWAPSSPSNSSLVSSKRQKVKDDTKPRPYQLELLDAAINENTIVNLGTGAGKTFIAVMLIREYSYEILEPFSEPDAKRTVFLVNTVPLVKQQADYIENHSLLDVGRYVGAMNVDSWLRGRWQREFDEHHVLVMTHTIFRKCLESGFVHLRKINLLIFDECHHAVKNHEYVQIMKIFDSCQMDEHPRVLGLSASLIPSKCKQGDLERKIKDLEEILRCRAEAARDLEEVAKYATNPDEVIEYYRSSSEDAHIAELRRTLEGPVNFLEAFKKERKTAVYDKVKLYLDDCLHILENLGIWCAHDFSQGGLQELMEDIAEMGEVLDDWEKSLMHLAVTHLQIFKQESEKKLDLYPSKEFPSTSKVKKLFDHLAKYKGSDDARFAADPAAQRNLLGIVFVERRTTAVQLSKLLKNKKKLNRTLKHIECDYIVGHNEGRGGTHLRREAHMTIKKQEEVLKKFRKGKINLVMATTVMEEGVDVPQCNLVVRFDFPQNFRSYIQSKGRARAKPSTYLVLVQGDSRQIITSQLCNYHVLEEELKHLCHDRHAPEEEEVLKKMEDRVQPYMPYGREAGTRATLSSSLSLIHHYCQKLPSDRYTVLTPVFKTEKRHVELHKDRFGVYEMDDVGVQQEFEYRSHMMLPINCPVKDETTGLWMPTRRIAEKSAALVGIKKLHEAGALNEHLKPVAKDILDSDEEDDVKVEESRINHAGTEKRGQYYSNEVAPCLSDCFPAVGPGNYLYAFIIREEGSPGLYLDHPHIGQPTTLGLLTRKPLPNLRIPEFSLYEHEKELHVSMKKFDWNKVNTICLTEHELIILTQCHKAIFTDVLGIAGTYLQFGFEKSEKNYLVVPLGILLPDMEHYLDMDLARKVAEMGSNPLASNQPLEWPCPLDVFVNALVTGIHCPLSDQKLHKVCSIDESTTPLSPFPDPRYASFAEYFESKYNFRFSDLQQPALKCKRVSSGESRLRLLTSRFKSTQGEDLDMKTTRDDVVLFPECCSLYPLPANFWMLVRCLPSILWRVECTALVDVFRSTVASETRTGFSSEGREYTTCTTLRGYQDYGFGDLKTQCFSTSSRGEEDAYVLNSPTSTLRGPDNALLLQALTPKGASDSINLERLETLGDSFLKLATSVYLFCDLPQHTHEGNLSMARSRRVGNLNLYILAKGKHIPGKVFSKGFEPKQMWIPPCTYFDTSDLSQATPEEMPPLDSKQCHYQYNKVTDKGVADCVESLLGAYLVSGGIESGLRFMKWMGIKINKKAQPQIAAEALDDECMFQTSLSSSPSTPPKTKRPKTEHTLSFTPVPLVIRDSSAIFANHFGSPPSALFDPCKQKEVERLLKVSMGSLQPQMIQGVINWTFTDTSFLLQALTHASYTRNRVTDCYQRLEFLGDAVLDYLVTCYIYQTFPNFGPGEISGMRSALVNNNTFAELAVNLKLHKTLLHNSPALFKQIPTYVEALHDQRAADQQAQEEEEEEEDISATVTVGTIKDQSDSTSEDDSLYEEELDPPKVLGDILESVAGAVFLDSGMNLNAVWGVFKHLFQKKIDEFGGKVPVLPVQELYVMEPNAKCTSTKLKRDGVLCTITVPDKGIQVSANGRSLRAAKTAAARAMVKKLKTA